MQKSTVKLGNTSTTDFRPEKKSNTAPKITLTFVCDDTGEVMYELDNGRQQSKANYDKFWNPVKTPIRKNGYKGENIGSIN